MGSWARRPEVPGVGCGDGDGSGRDGGGCGGRGSGGARALMEASGLTQLPCNLSAKTNLCLATVSPGTSGTFAGWAAHTPDFWTVQG